MKKFYIFNNMKKNSVKEEITFAEVMEHINKYYNTTEEDVLHNLEFRNYVIGAMLEIEMVAVEEVAVEEVEFSVIRNDIYVVEIFDNLQEAIEIAQDEFNALGLQKVTVENQDGHVFYVLEREEEENEIEEEEIQEPCRLCGTSSNEFELCSQCFDYTQEMMREVEIEEEEGYFYGKERAIGRHHSQEEIVVGVDFGSSCTKTIRKEVEPCHICGTSSNEFDLCGKCWGDMEKEFAKQIFAEKVSLNEKTETKKEIESMLEETLQHLAQLGSQKRTTRGV